MMKSVLVATIATFSLAGCVTLPPYVAPRAGEPTAIVDVSRVNPSSICTNGVLYSVGKTPDGKLPIPANGRVAIYSWVSIAEYQVTYSCMPGVSFRPMVGASYLINLEIEDERCMMEVYRQGAKNRIGLDVEYSAGSPQNCQAESITPEVRAQSVSFLESASQKPGMVVLPSGVRYHVIEAGTGQRPVAGSTVEAEIRGSMTTGKVFVDTSTTGKPAKFKVGDFPLAGVREAVLLMPVGSRWEVYVPAELAFGNAPNSPIGPGQAVVFDIKLNSAQ